MINHARALAILTLGFVLLLGILFLAGGASAVIASPATDFTDLDVTYIERTPRYPRDLRCTAGTPRIDYPCPSPQKQFPDPGEMVTFTAHISNKGNLPVSQFGFSWTVDGATVLQATHAWLPGSDQMESWQWAWQPGQHRIRLAVSSPGDAFVGNNERETRTDAYALSVFVEEGQYQALNERLNLIGSHSFEDWIQAQFDRFNQTFTTAKYPVTPNGILGGVRVDKIVVAAEMDGQTPNAFRLDPDEFLNDGRWLFSDGDPTNAVGYASQYGAYADAVANTIDWGLIHELAHQIGRFDMYNIDFAPEHNLITGPDGAPLHIGHSVFYGQDIMQSPGSGTWSEYSAASFNRDYGERAGMFGAYLQDLPADNWLRIINQSGQPAAGAALRIYHDQDEVLNDNSLVLSGNTDGSGFFHLGTNPYGQLSVAGTNATLFISMTVAGQSEYHWLEATAFNMAFWRGHQSTATFTLTLGLPDHQDWSLPPLLQADTSAPQAILLQPAPGDLLSGLAVFAADASDDRTVKRVEIMVDGHSIWVFERPPYQIVWDTAQLANGTHRVWVRAWDYSLPAKVVDSPAVTIAVQNSIPHLFAWDFAAMATGRHGVMAGRRSGMRARSVRAQSTCLC